MSAVRLTKMNALKAVTVYFARVFATGFVLGSIRVPFLVPRLGVRYAELIEMPIMSRSAFFFATSVLTFAGNSLISHYP